MIDNTIIVEIDMPNEIDVDLGDAKFITAPEKQVPQAVPQIDVDNNGLITATSVQEAGSVRAGTTKSIYQLAVEQGKTISPSGESQVAIEKGRFAVGDIVVSPLKVQEKELNVTDGGNYEVVPDNDYLLSKVDVNVDISAKVDEAFEAGKQAEYDAFWDAYQQNGERTDYSHSFAGVSWSEETLRPKYDIKPVKAYNMFLNLVCATQLDLTAHFEKLGIKLDTSNCTNFNCMFMYNAPIRVPTIDTRSAPNLIGAFNYSTVKIFDKLILKDDGSQTFDNAFISMGALEEINIEGVIGQNIDMHWSTRLTHESLMSIINALKNGVSGLTCTLGTTNLAKLTDAEKAIATEKGWSLA